MKAGEGRFRCINIMQYSILISLDSSEEPISAASSWDFQLSSCRCKLSEIEQSSWKVSDEHRPSRSRAIYIDSRMRPAILRSSIIWTKSQTDLAWKRVAVFASCSVSWSRLLNEGIAVSIAWSRTDKTLPVFRAMDLLVVLDVIDLALFKGNSLIRTSPDYRQSTTYET